MLTLDFPQYLATSQKAQHRFFQDQMARPTHNQMLVTRGAKNNYPEPVVSSGELGLEGLQAEGHTGAGMALRKKSLEEPYAVQNENLGPGKRYMESPPFIDEMPSEDEALNPLATLKKASAPPTTTPKQNQITWTQMSINCIMNSGAFSSDEMLNALNERAFGLT